MTISSQWVKTQDGSYTLFDDSFQQSYHSLAGAFSECEFVFLNPVCEHSQKKDWKLWQVLDVGFGLGFNWLVFANHCYQNSIFLNISSLENNQKLLLLEPPKIENSAVDQTVLDDWRQLKKNLVCKNNFMHAQLYLNDAKASLKKLNEQNQKMNIVLQDAFSPNVNPEVWDHEYFDLLSMICEKDAIFTTYSAASAMQKKLKEFGFDVEKKPGFAGKRERIVAYKI